MRQFLRSAEKPLRFSSGLELGNLAVSSGVVRESWEATMEVERGTNQSRESFSSDSLRVYAFQHPKNAECTVVSFATSLSYTKENLRGAGGMISSNATELYKVFYFLRDDECSHFKLNKAAAELFISNSVRLFQLKSKVDKSKRLIICGRSMGGSVASLFTLMLLESIHSAPKSQKLPLCITFGSPLIGDSNLQKLISQTFPWDSCFLHFASLKDPIPKTFISSDIKTSAYKPFGAFLLGCDRGFACFEDPEVILELLGKMSPLDPESQAVDYDEIVERFASGVHCKDVLDLMQLNEWIGNPLQAGILAQLQAIGAQEGQNNININDLVEKLTSSIIAKRGRLRLAKIRIEKINKVKENMAQLEWYKKTAKCGYYDAFKNESFKVDVDVVAWKKTLKVYWTRIVEEAEKKPQVVRTRHLFGGTNYRRMAEPLDIAEYYRAGGIDYLTARRQRPEYKHYYILEQMLNETEKPKGGYLENKKTNVGSILTEDSCFWAHVEDAITLCRNLMDGEGSAEAKLLKFEHYVMKLIEDYAVNPEIFRSGSTFMIWWRLYEDIIANYSCLCDMPLTNFMKKHEYVNYAQGSYEKPPMQRIPYICGLTNCRRMAKIGGYFLWVFALINIIMEALSAYFDQVSSPKKPQYALAAMSISFVAVAMSFGEFIYKARKARVVLRRWGCVWWIFHQSPVGKRFGTFIDIFGLISSLLQCILSTIQYNHHQKHTESPIKISFCSLLFAICAACSRFFAQNQKPLPHAHIP